MWSRLRKITTHAEISKRATFCHYSMEGTGKKYSDFCFILISNRMSVFPNALSQMKANWQKFLVDGGTSNRALWATEIGR